jgi:hypothetical protein
MSNNNYDLIYITLNGKINIIKKDVWQKQTKFDGTTGSNITSINNIFKVSKITQINTGEFLYLGDDCNVYRVGSNFTNPTFVSDKQFLGITQLSNYKILLTSKDGKMYVVDDINNFDNTINQFFDDSTTYSSVKQTFDGYVVAIDGTQCGTSWRFDLKKNVILNKTKLNLDDAYKNRVTLFTPDQTALLNLNCDPRYKDTIYKYVFSDKTFRSSANDANCYIGYEYEGGIFNQCYKLCPDGYESRSGDVLSCWLKASTSYAKKSQKSKQDNSACDDLQDVIVGIKTCTGTVPKKCRTCKDVCSGFTGMQCYPLTCTGTTPKSCRSCSDACHGLKSVKCYSTTCTGVKSDGITVTTRSRDCSGGNIATRDLDCTGGNVVTRDSTVSCPSGYSFDSGDPAHIGLCYEDCRDGYEARPGDLISCWNKNPTTVPRGNGSDPISPTPITCNTNCCMFDLAFYNPLYTKPTTIVLPDTLPVSEGLVGFYDASTFQNNIWYDSSPSNNNAVYVKGTFDNNGTFISGSPSSSILFPTQILPREYTVFNIAKYNGASKGKILSGYLNNWFSGFANGLSGVAGRDKPITQTTLSAFDDNWVFSLDTKTTYGANGTYYNTLTSTDNTQTQLSINLNDDPKSNSDFAIACVIVFNRTLSGDEILSMQTWLTTKYADLYASTYTKTLGQLGYSCFNGSIGKVTNNYNNYSYASYKNGTLGCEWLNLPEKKSFNPIVCTSVSSENYETFDNTDNYNYFPDYIFYPLAIILVIIILYKRNHKD